MMDEKGTPKKGKEKRNKYWVVYPISDFLHISEFQHHPRILFFFAKPDDLCQKGLHVEYNNYMYT